MTEQVKILVVGKTRATRDCKIGKVYDGEFIPAGSKYTFGGVTHVAQGDCVKIIDDVGDEANIRLDSGTAVLLEG